MRWRRWSTKSCGATEFAREAKTALQLGELYPGDAGVLAGKQAGERVPKPSAEQAEIARLRRELDRAERRLATTETALTIMGKAHALLEQISESAELDDRREKR